MKQVGSISKYSFVLFYFSVGLSLFFVGFCATETTTSNFRSTYDAVMKWVNFFIFITVFLKYGYNPFKRFIQLQIDSVKRQIDELETKRSAAILELELAKKFSQKNESRLEKINKNIILEGEKKCLDIIEQANQESKIMLEDAYSKAEVNLKIARKTIKNRIIDTAVSLAENKLKNHIDDNYRDTLFDNYMKNI